MLANGSTQTPEALLREAELALNRAKGEGGGHQALFDDVSRNRAAARRRTELDLRRAIRRCEFCLHYQPVLGLRTGEVVDVEALVRWRHPDRGLLPPGEFIDLAEDTGLIVPIGAIVLADALAQAKLWRTITERQTLTVAVNLSARQLAQPDLVHTVARALARTGTTGAELCLEITETAVMADAEAAVAKLGELRALGIALAIDDFGTGYSSPSYLKRLPADVLKIDRAFVAGLGDDSESSVIPGAVIGLAHALGMTTIAEGVETATQGEELQRLGCDAAQGYYYARPAPADAVTALLRSVVVEGFGAAAVVAA